MRDVIETNRRRKLVDAPARFAIQELRATGRPTELRLVETGQRVLLRPGTRDTDILQEIFRGEGMYSPPEAVHAKLRERSLRVLDLGGNIGLFGLDAFRRYDVGELVSFEPDPGNLPLLAANISHNGLDDRWLVRPDCVSNRAGTVRFEAGLFANSRVTPDANDGMAVPCIDFFELGPSDLVKVDIEGSEWEILFDERLPAVPTDVLVLEWHAAQCPSPDFAWAAHRCLQEAGFSVLDAERAVRSGTLWAWR
ncbi:MAG: FkbM family methyltransferase [Solirubrobacteraceae bacterium]